MGERTENDTVAELARSAAAEVRITPGVEYMHDVVLPPGHQHHVVDLERFQAAPRRHNERVDLHTQDALAAYVNRHKDERTMVYADLASSSIVAVLNGSTAGRPGWGDHRATLKLRPTRAWTHWAGRDGKIEGQSLFAEHIEVGVRQIVDPPAADMLELAENFHATVTAGFTKAERLADGQRAFKWQEEIDARAGSQGQITIPAQFTLMVAPFEGLREFEIKARLRYRLRDGKLTIGYSLVDPEDIREDAFASVLESFHSATVLPVLMGTPPVRP